MADNTPEEIGNQQPEPKADTHGVPKEVEPVENEPAEAKEVDPGYQQWLDDTKNLETAFKRYSDSSKEAERFKKELEDIRVERDEVKQNYQAVAEDFDKLRQTNPQLFEQVKQAVDNLGVVDNPPQEVPITEEKVAQTVRLEVELGSFKNDYKELVKNEEDFDNIRRYAAGLSGKKDRDGKPFNLRSALVAALQYYHPEVLTDKVKMETIAEVEQRNSASEPANVPGGSATGKSTKALSKSENEAAAFFNMTTEEYRKYQKE